MKKEVNKDEFAKFMAEIIFKVDVHNFDVMYDIAVIMEKVTGEFQSTNYPEKTTYHLMTRSMGCDLVEPSDNLYEDYKTRNDYVYELEFCLNHERFNEIPFCIITKIVS